MAETRSSHSETASLKDFALGAFDLCSINVEKICVEDSQTIDNSTDPPKFTTTHLVTIENDGFGGNLRDVELADPSAVSGDKCTIKAITLEDGTATIDATAVGFVYDVANESREVADSLGGTISVELECVSTDNPFQNTVSVKSRAALGAPQDVTDTDEETTVEAGVCEFDLHTGIALRKWCQGDDGEALGHPMGPNPAFLTPDDENPLGLSVFLKPPNYVPQVCVDIEVSNTSEDQRMVVKTFTDSDLGDLMPVGGLELAPKNTSGDSFIVSRCYTGIPDQANPGHTNPVDPTIATYTDSVSATAEGKIDKVAASAGPVTATCELCPPHND
jgi:hypothetical protein